MVIGQATHDEIAFADVALAPRQRDQAYGPRRVGRVHGLPPIGADEILERLAGIVEGERRLR